MAGYKLDGTVLRDGAGAYVAELIGWDDAELSLLMGRASVADAEPAPTPEFVWVRLLEAMHGDNGAAFTASTDDYREASGPLADLIAAGFFRGDADSLDGDIWMAASGEETEAAVRFERCADAYAALSAVLNRVFERDDQAYDRNAERLTAEALGTGSGINMAATSVDELFDEPSLPPAGVEDVEVVGYRVQWTDRPGGSALNLLTAITPPIHLLRAEYPNAEIQHTDDLMTVAQCQRIVAARDAAIEEWSGTAVQNGMEVDRLRALMAAGALVPRELLDDAEKHLTDWLDLHDCECEGGHICGRGHVRATRDRIHALLAAPAVAGHQHASAARDVLIERQRQVAAEGWSPEHDDEHDGGELAAAGAAYALHAADHLNPYSQGDGGDEAPNCWPWHDAVAGRGEGPEATKPAWWKPGTPRRDLIKAAALILAEIERMDRAAAPAEQGGDV
ncbi:hypothetical protein K32_48470 [Kaistia sp. 32K]|uniref:hypothetical protein n=1 Tax=Kaistia sp. 32K TaxID=2795690 RepID=UPI0019162BE3|nr:hypothetical protein [Kaistia sp. 32K]BCP56230.1 hypothetical protein K32_48470 [Kaistia sp. 32K]